MATFETVDDYISSLEDPQARVVAELRRLVREAAPQATEAIKWAQPVFEHNGPVCYIKAFKNHVNIGFWRGAELPGGDRLLGGTGDKMRHVKIGGPDDIPEEQVRELVRQAVALNQQRGDPTRGSRGGGDAR